MPRRMLRKASLEAGATELQAIVPQESVGMNVLAHPWRKGAFRVTVISKSDRRIQE